MQHERTKMISAELAKIAQRNGGILLPERVVEFASDPETALHGQFEWDDTEAARKYRIEQARAVIRLSVIVVGDAPEPVRAYVSLSSDREHGGYRRMVDVLSRDDLAAQLLADAMAEIRSVLRKYETIAKLKPIWDAMKTIDEGGERAAG